MKILKVPMPEIQDMHPLADEFRQIMKDLEIPIYTNDHGF